jgi:6-phosphogluconolactonase (cycloisomerase 2 family)
MFSSIGQAAFQGVLVQSNEEDHNRLLSFRRDAGGALSGMSAVDSGGAGNGEAHLPSQGSVTLSGDARHAFVTNAGSGDLSVFIVAVGKPALAQTLSTDAGSLSVAEHDGLVYVLNSGEASLSGFVTEGGRLSPVSGEMRRWDPEGKPAQVGFSPDGRALVVTERGADRILTFPVESSGSLGKPVSQPASGVTPYGFGFTPAGVLVVTEAFGGEPGRSAVSSYAVKDSALTPVSHSVGNGRTALCWAVVTGDGRYAFGTNFGDGAVSRYDIAPDGTITLGEAAAGVVVDGSSGPRDLAFSADGRFLCAIDADSQQLVGWSVDSGGRLSQIGSWGGLPSTVAGIAAS